MLSWQWLSAITVGAFAASWAGTWGALVYLRRRGVLAHPNERSSHTQPTPTGGGAAAIAVLIAVWVLAATLGPAQWGANVIATVAVVSLGAVLAAISWLDDLRGGLSPALRFGVQALAVAGGVAALPGPVFQGLLPPVVDGLAVALVWLWFVNLFNFMDGIDGIAGVQAIGIGVGVALVASAAGLPPIQTVFGMSAAAVAMGFLPWNWRPAKIFMGDAGSVGLGYLLGWLLLVLAAQGQWAAAIILPLYFLSDATLTLIRRILRRETLWKAHRGHFYQKAAAAAGDHRAVMRPVGIVQMGLVVLAGFVVLVPGSEGYGLLAATVLVVALLWYLRRMAAGNSRP